MTAKIRLGRLEAAQRRRPVEEKPFFDLDALTEDEVRFLVDNIDRDIESLTADEAAAFAVICQKGKVAK